LGQHAVVKKLLQILKLGDHVVPGDIWCSSRGRGRGRLRSIGLRFSRLGAGVVCDRSNTPDDCCSPQWPSSHHGFNPRFFVFRRPGGPRRNVNLLPCGVPAHLLPPAPGWTSGYHDQIAKPIPYPEPRLGGSALVLRPFEVRDLSAAMELGEDSATGLPVPPLPASDPARVMQLFEEYRSNGELILLAIADPASDAYLGEVMLTMGEHQTGEFGCGVVSAARRRGLATQALGMLTRWSVTALDIRRLQVLVAQENTPALHLAERVGFRREGVLRSYWEQDGVRADVVMLSMLPGEVPGGRPNAAA
jgi:[ribosomal protein S5]-alanine N-acetyltransferase